MTPRTSNLCTQETSSQPTLRAKASQAYARQSSASREEELIVRYLPLVRHVVHKVATNIHHQQDVEDLISAGTVGLVKAARNYSASRDADFKTYAYIRIRGAVIDELRSRSPLSSAVHHKIRDLQEVYERFASSNGRPPSDEELAQKLNIPLQDMYKILDDARRQNFLSIHGIMQDEPVLGAFAPASHEPSPDAEAERKEMLERMAQAIQELPERDRVVLLLYYERDLTMKEAAKVLEVTESRVSQIHSSALFKLSMKLKENGK